MFESLYLLYFDTMPQASSSKAAEKSSKKLQPNSDARKLRKCSCGCGHSVSARTERQHLTVDQAPLYVKVMHAMHAMKRTASGTVEAAGTLLKKARESLSPKATTSAQFPSQALLSPSSAGSREENNTAIPNSWPGSPMAVNTPTFSALGGEGVSSSLVQQTLDLWGEERGAGHQILDDEEEDRGLDIGGDDEGEDGELEYGDDEGEDGGPGEGDSDESEDEGLEEGDKGNEDGRLNRENDHLQNPTPEMEDMIQELSTYHVVLFTPEMYS